HVSSDFIIGFPGETDADFEATMELVEEADIDFSYSFIYSPRPGTPAAEWDDPIPAEVKKARLDRLQSRLAQTTRAKTEAMVGTRQKVLLDAVSTRFPGHLEASAFNTRLIHVNVADVGQIGHFAEVQIEEALSTNALRGRLLQIYS
ncbi:MAG: TRAM domain-containing protein, partial [Pseudomonadales bacterium]|nr:TRAM domain-containing protein [Pseudomonadales bacterium]